MENENIIEHTYADEVSPLTLAFVGDGVYDLLVRAYLVRQSNRPVGELNKIKVGFVNCKSQAEYAKVLIPHLSEKELLFGPLLLQQKGEVFIAKWQQELKQFKNILNQLKKSTKNVTERLEEVQTKIDFVNEVLK